MSLLFQVVYTSTAVRDFGRAELLELVEIFAERNARDGITGLLLCQGRRFMQVLEGTEAAVIHLFAKIAHDPRHHRIVPLIHTHIERRYFPDTALAFPELDSPGLQEVPGFGQFVNPPAQGPWQIRNILECQKLLFFIQGIQENLPQETGVQPPEPRAIQP